MFKNTGQLVAKCQKIIQRKSDRPGKRELQQQFMFLSAESFTTRTSGIISDPIDE